MNRIGIISGGGKLPLAIGEKLIQSKYDVVFFCIENFCDLKLYKKYNFNSIKINSLSKILKILKEQNINEIILAGYVKRPSLKDISFDINSLKLIKTFALEAKGDDKLLKTILIFFENQGFKIFDWKSKCQDLFIDKINLTIKKPSNISLKNKRKGLNIFEKIGKADISQSLVVQNNIILGIEAAEGTDELLKRCYSYKKKGDKGILIKLSKYKQSSHLDIPVIGLKTLKNLKKYNYEGIFLEINKCIIIDKKQVIDFANKNNIFISGTKKN